MPTNITSQLEDAQTIIRNVLCSHQATPDKAVNYAMRFTGLPLDLKGGLTEYAEQVKKNDMANRPQ
jgi:hypothetical protein